MNENLNETNFIWITKPFRKRQILDSSKLKEPVDDNFKSDENGRMFYERVENTVGNGEIARYKQFLLFQQCFKRLVLQTRKNQGLFGEGLTGQRNNFITL